MRHAFALRRLEREHRGQLEALDPEIRSAPPSLPPRRPHVTAVERERNEREAYEAYARRVQLELERTRDLLSLLTLHSVSEAEKA